MRDDYKVMQELISLSDKEKVEQGLSYQRMVDRIGVIQDVLRDAILTSSLGVYSGKMYYFSGAIYRELTEIHFGHMVYDLLKELGIPAGDFCRIESIIKVLKRAVYTKELEVNKNLVVFRNCVYDTCSRLSKPFGKRHIQLVQLDYPFDYDAQCCLWVEFLNRVLPNKVFQDVLQEYLGSLFIPRKEAKMETLMILYGNGSNGKSVVFDTIVGILGRDSVSCFGLDELIGKGQERKRNIASINGKRLNYSSETRGMVIDGDSGTLKALISGEPIEARALYGDNFTADEIPQIMINTNVLPRLEDWTHGMRRRIRILPFDVEIPEEKQDKELSMRLREEYPGIFNWIMEGRDRFVRNGYKLTVDEALEEIVEAYEEESSSVIRFMRAMGYAKTFKLVKDAAPYWVKVKTLYNEYMAWCGANHEYFEKRVTFGRKLKEAGYKSRRIGTGVEYAIYGIEAIRQLIDKTKEEAILLRRSAFYEQIRDHSFVKVKERARYEEEMGGKVAVGVVELAQYLCISTSAVNTMDAKGQLSGMYKIYNNRKVFLLEMIDEKILPMIDESYLIRLERKQAKEAKEMARYEELLTKNKMIE